jgi:hypothetical protein
LKAQNHFSRDFIDLINTLSTANMVVIHGHICGCYYTTRPTSQWSYPPRVYLPQVNVSSHTTIFSTTSRTVLKQTFVNPSKAKGIRELRYTFPLFDGVSVVGFRCDVNDRTIIGEVKEREEARKEFEEARDRGEVAGLLEQLPDASDVFTTTIGNVQPGAKIKVSITYLGELKHDAQVNGARFTIPTCISPRYGSYPGTVSAFDKSITNDGKFEAVVDIQLENGAFIKEVNSPSHPVAVSNGTISTAQDDDPVMSKASVTLSQGSVEMDSDFIVQIVSKDFATPAAMLETHPKYPNHKALMATLVPNFQLETQRPEIVFICDRSGSMEGGRIEALKKSLQTFLKSLPVGVVFNICSFGSSHTFLWEKSMPYDAKTLKKAVDHVKTFDANYGGTEMVSPIRDTLDRRHKDRNMEVFLVTDGEIWDQNTLFDLLNQRIQDKKEPVRIFTLGIGDQVSTALIEGVARAGNGFCQAVGENEKMDSKVVRMLKGALLPHINDYKLELNFLTEDGEEHVVNASAPQIITIPTETKAPSSIQKKISLFDKSANPDAPITQIKDLATKVKLPEDHILQAPSEIPALFSFMRKTVYLLLPNLKGDLKSVTLSGTAPEGEVSLDIPVTILKEPGETFHQLAAKKAILELEEGRGWITTALVSKGSSDKPKLLSAEYPSLIAELAKREAVRLGVQFQVGGKNCSFVAVEKKTPKKNTALDTSMADASESEDTYDFLDEDIDAMTLSDGHSGPQAEGGMSALVDLSSTLSASYGGYVAQSLGASGPPRPMMKKSVRSRGGISSIGQSLGGVFRKSSSVSSGPLPPPPPGAAFGMSAPAPASRMALASGAPPPAPLSKPSSPIVKGSSMSNRPAVDRRAAPVLKEKKEKSKKSSWGLSKLTARRSTEDRTCEVEEDEAEEDSEDSGDGASAEKMDVEKDMTIYDEVVMGKKDKAKSRASESDDAILSKLTDLQTFEGSWTWSTALLKLIKVNENNSALTKAIADGVTKEMLATVLVVTFLEKKLAGEQGTWDLMVEKARDWVAGELGKEKAKDLYGIAGGIII